MIHFETFNAWQSVLGFLTIVFFFFIYPFVKDDSIIFKSFFWFGFLLTLITPYIIKLKPNEEMILLLLSGKILHTYTLILFFYCYINRKFLLKELPYFFWFCYALGLASIFEFFLIDVLFNNEYYFLAVASPYLKKEWGIVDFNFTAPANYLIKFIFLGLFFKNSLKDTFWKNLFHYTIYILIVFELIQAIIFKSYQSYDSLSSTIKNIFILGSAGLLLYRIYSNPAISLPHNKNAYFWICLGLLLPCLAELFIEFIFSKLYETNITGFYKLYLVRNTSQLIGFILLIVGTWQAKYLRFAPKEY